MNSNWFTAMSATVLFTMATSACGLISSPISTVETPPEVSSIAPTTVASTTASTTANPAFTDLAQNTTTEAAAVTGKVLKLAATKLAEGSGGGIDTESLWYAVAVDLGEDVQVLTSTGVLVADSGEQHGFFQVERTFTEAVCVARILVAPSPSPTIDDVGGASIETAVCR